MDHKKLVVGNLKMKMTLDEIGSYLDILNKEVDSNQVVLCPSSIYIPYFLKNRYAVGLQNVFADVPGSYTGEIAPSQAYSMGIMYVIIGHSERRQNFFEDDTMVAMKVKSALEQNLKVILCVGETKEQRELHKTEMVVKNQLKGALKDLDCDLFSNLYVAYEPIWAIGAGVIPTNADIGYTSDYIKHLVYQHFNISDIPVLYGGSVNKDNIRELSKIPNIAGFLVGTAATIIEDFLEVIEVVVNQ